MRDMVAACAAGFLAGSPMLDLNYAEDSGGGPDVSVALHPGLDRVVLLQVSQDIGVVCASPQLPRGWWRSVGQRVGLGHLCRIAPQALTATCR